MPQFSQFSTLANSGDQPPAAEHVSLENVPPHTHTKDFLSPRRYRRTTAHLCSHLLYPHPVLSALNELSHLILPQTPSCSTEWRCWGTEKSSIVLGHTANRNTTGLRTPGCGRAQPLPLMEPAEVQGEQPPRPNKPTVETVHPQGPVPTSVSRSSGTVLCKRLAFYFET